MFKKLVLFCLFCFSANLLLATETVADAAARAARAARAASDAASKEDAAIEFMNKCYNEGKVLPLTGVHNFFQKEPWHAPAYINATYRRAVLFTQKVADMETLYPQRSSEIINYLRGKNKGLYALAYVQAWFYKQSDRDFPGKIEHLTDLRELYEAPSDTWKEEDVSLFQVALDKAILHWKALDVVQREALKSGEKALEAAKSAHKKEVAELKAQVRKLQEQQEQRAAAAAVKSQAQNIEIKQLTAQIAWAQRALNPRKKRAVEK